MHSKFFYVKSSEKVQIKRGNLESKESVQLKTSGQSNKITQQTLGSLELIIGGCHKNCL